MARSPRPGEIIAIERNLLDILKRQFNAGQAAQADVLAQDAALAQAEELLPPLEKQLAQQRDLLTALAGQLSANEIEQKFDLSHLKLPTNLPVSLPSKLVDQRPDVRAAEANMHSASAQVGVAIAARLAKYRALGQWRVDRLQFRAELHAGDRISIRSPRAPPLRYSMALRFTTSRRRLRRRSIRPRPSIAPPSSPHSRMSRMHCAPCSRTRGRSRRPARRRYRKGQPRHRPEAAERRAGQSTRRPQCAADLPDRRHDPRTNRSQSPLRYGRVCSWRLVAAGPPPVQHRFGGNAPWETPVQHLIKPTYVIIDQSFGLGSQPNFEPLTK